MERSLDPELLGLALGGHERLPTAEEFSQLLTNAELALLLRDPSVPDVLTATGWYLHGIASSKFALKFYGVERQRAAFQVSGHIFDLQLHTTEISDLDKYKYCFAAQIAYARSSLDPNAIALYRREFPAGLSVLNLIPDFQLAALSCGIAFLGFDVKYIYSFTSNIRAEVVYLVNAWNIDEIGSTLYGAAANVASGVRDLMSFLLYGKPELLENARRKFTKSIKSDASLEDDLSRWVAAHLLSFSGRLEQSSIWNILPPDVPQNVRKAFVNGSPRILTLWPPQIDFLGLENDINPFADNVKRMLISTPTSGGKTLTAQLLITVHLATKFSSVCYVAPTRSLCREVRLSLQSRLRFIGKRIVDGLPEGDWLNSILEDLQPDVEVMTPERLSYLIKTDSNRLLNHFGLFIFDEVHLVGDKGRGWTLEEDLSFLHYATENTNHKIALVSAVIGNRNHFIQWLEGNEKSLPPLAFHSDWRGPRRIHAIWTSEAFWNDSVISQNPRGKKYLFQKITPLHGRLDVRISHTGDTHTLNTTTPIGELVRKAEDEYGHYQKDSSKSTPFYKMLVSVIDFLADFGPVLIIEATKSKTIQLAEAIAETKETINSRKIVNLIDLVTARLGINHPLKRVLEKGVAYHHGSLPSEIRNALEEAVSAGHLKYIVATTTLTEGINLPVTSVLIASQGSYGEGGYTEYITGSKLVNAIGRAGRATKETEGIVVLARQAKLTQDDFDRLSPDENELLATSMLARDEALEELAIFEELSRKSEDAVLETDGSAIPDFLKFVWFIIAELERSGKNLGIEQIQEILSCTLGWVQLSQPKRFRWLQTANVVLMKYQNTQEAVRRRWASSGISIRSSSSLEHMVQEIISEVKDCEISQSIIDVTKLVIGKNRLQRILQFSEAPKRNVYSRRGGTRDVVSIPSELLLIDWLEGISLIDISEKYFSRVDDIDFRFEQLGDYIYNRFEVFLPWVFGTIISWVNEALIQEGVVKIFPKNIPANIRYGVGCEISLGLMIRGVQSRNLAIRIANVWRTQNQDKNVISWIRSLNLAQWVEMFDASPNDIRSLLEVARLMQGSVTSKLFSNGVAELDVISNFDEYPQTEVTLQSIDDSDISEIGIWHDGSLLGTLLCKDHVDVQNFLGTGLALGCQFTSTSGKGVLELNLLEYE